MTYWLDANLPPSLAPWLFEAFGVSCTALRDLNLDRADDLEIFAAAKERGAIVIVSKDSDFADLVVKLGSPPQILWVTCGNTSSANLQELFRAQFPAIHELFMKGEALVELKS